MVICLILVTATIKGAADHAQEATIVVSYDSTAKHASADAVND